MSDRVKSGHYKTLSNTWYATLDAMDKDVVGISLSRKSKITRYQGVTIPFTFHSIPNVLHIPHTLGPLSFITVTSTHYIPHILHVLHVLHVPHIIPHN